MHPGQCRRRPFPAWPAYHYGTGICYGIIFALLIHPFLPLGNTVLGNISKALIFAFALAFLSAGLWVAKNFPQFDSGFFSHNLGWKTVLGIFIWHGVYGLHLGAIYNPLPRGALSSGTETTV